MVINYGVQGAFMKSEKYGLSVHFASRVLDTDGSGMELLQYSYADLKEDALHDATRHHHHHHGHHHHH